MSEQVVSAGECEGDGLVLGKRTYSMARESRETEKKDDSVRREGAAVAGQRTQTLRWFYIISADRRKLVS